MIKTFHLAEKSVLDQIPLQFATEMAGLSDPLPVPDTLDPISLSDDHPGRGSGGLQRKPPLLDGFLNLLLKLRYSSGWEHTRTCRSGFLAHFSGYASIGRKADCGAALNIAAHMGRGFRAYRKASPVNTLCHPTRLIYLSTIRGKGAMLIVRLLIRLLTKA
ncbi:hypothetical protein LIA77_00203 [Sarocladium implicatum]|nr:hypothetical protein LIA77_00203 [Sarocladium implicatum]